MNIAILLLLAATLTTTIYCEEETEKDKEERITAELRLTDLELADDHEEIARTRKKVLLHKAKYSNEIELLESYGNYLQEQSVNFRKIPEDDISYESQRNYTLLLKPGDFILNTTDLHELFKFAKENDHLSRNLKINHPTNADQVIGKQTFLDLLATSRNLSFLENLWINWQTNVSYYSDHFRKTLSLVTKAASLNELYDAKAYWEMLVEYENGYQQIEDLWNDIEPTYRKLHEFVLMRINNYYKTNFTNIPVYLTGSNFGEDWSNLASLILPHQQMYKDAEFAFEEQSIVEIYKLVDACGQQMGFKPCHRKFFSKVNFNYDICKPTLLPYSASKYTEILTCKNVTWNSYLSAHEAVLEVGVKGLDYQSLPRRELRQSFLDEAIVNLGSVIAIQNLPNYGFTPESDYTDFENGLAAKLLLALRVLPKLAYYIAADVWRLEELQNPSENIVNNWWEIRKKYQGIQGTNETDEEADFLDDPYIVSNRPYLAKFLGAVLQFQLVNYHQLIPFTHNENLAERLKYEVDFRGAIQEIPLKSPIDVLSYNYAITDIVSLDLTEFFQPLEEYLDSAPLLPYPTLPRIRKVEIPFDMTTRKISTTTTKATTVKIELPPVQNDQHVPPVKKSNNESIAPASTSPTTAHSAGMYVVITIGACFFILAGVLVFKKLVKMKGIRTNNRRFET